MTYLTLVVLCKLLLGKGARPTAGEKKSKASIADKIKQDGLVLFGAMAFYNTAQVTLCAWMVFVLHVFYLSKVLDFADTGFMIIKGNWRQVSFLHVYHHASIFLIYWLNAQANYDADIYFTIVLNGAIHFVMYGYYLATAFNVQVPVIIKKSITNAQLVQFICMEVQGTWLLLGGCDTPRNVTILYMVYISTMFVLFLNFKRMTYSG